MFTIFLKEIALSFNISALWRGLINIDKRRTLRSQAVKGVIIYTARRRGIVDLTIRPVYISVGDAAVLSEFMFGFLVVAAVAADIVRRGAVFGVHPLCPLGF